MPDKWSDQLRARSWQDLAPGIYIALVGQLFGTPALTNLVEVLLVATIGGLAAWHSNDPWLAGLTLATCLAILAIIPLRGHFEARHILEQPAPRVRAFERLFELLSWAVSGGIGLMAARGVLATDDALVHLMLISLALGAGTANIRYHARPRIAFGRTLAISGPLIAAVMLTGDPYYLALGFVAAAATKLSIDICRQLYRGLLNVLTTIDEKERLAVDLKAANAVLERREAERREAEAAVTRLRTELTHVSRLSAMGAMASTLAHELNQPLTAVTNYVRGSRRLLEHPDAANLERIDEAMEAAEGGALRAGQIIRRLRGLVNRGKAETRPENLEELIRETCDLALVDAARLGVTHRFDLTPDARWANIDHVQVQQVLINIIRNAVEAMRDCPQREIDIATRVAGDFIEVSVADTGPGIGRDTDGVLFTPFSSTKTEGLGIGLSISRTIVEAHGGKIWATGREGGGAAFRFTLPRTLAPDLSSPDVIREAS